MDERDEDALRRVQELRRAGLALDEALEAQVGRIFVGLRPYLVRLCTRRVGDPQRGEELAQEAIAEAWLQLDRFEFRGDLRAWLSTIADFKCANARRKMTERLTDDGVLKDLPVVAEVLRGLRDAEQRDVLLRCLGALPPLEQEIVHHRYFDGVPIRELNERFGLRGASGARAVLVRARRHLRATLRTALVEMGHGSSFFRTLTT